METQEVYTKLYLIFSSFFLILLIHTMECNPRKITELLLKNKGRDKLKDSEVYGCITLIF
jgi:hypothetical protein